MNTRTKAWWKYPANVNQNLNPWYIITWRFLWILPILLTFGVLYALLVFSGGKRHADHLAREIFR